MQLGENDVLASFDQQEVEAGAENQSEAATPPLGSHCCVTDSIVMIVDIYNYDAKIHQHKIVPK